MAYNRNSKIKKNMKRIQGTKITCSPILKMQIRLIEDFHTMAIVQNYYRGTHAFHTILHNSGV